MAFKMKGFPMHGTSSVKKYAKPAPTKHIGKHPAPETAKDPGHTHKGQKLFQVLHGAVTGTKGKKFVDTKLGQDLAEKKKDVVTKTVDKKLEKKDETNVPATNLKVHKSSSGSGETKPSSRKPETYTASGNPNETFVRGGGDPYQYQTKDGGKTFQYKKVGETKWSDVKGGEDKISAAYQESKKEKSSPTTKKSPAKNMKTGKYKQKFEK
jgi:hypothetical protein